MDIFFNEKHKQATIQKSLEPMTELYLKQFFKNYFVKQNHKQTQNMFSTSIEVLEGLIEQYQQKFGFQRQNFGFQSKGSELEFEQFYDRLKRLFQKLEDTYGNIQLSQKYKQRISLQNQDDSLFPENRDFSYRAERVKKQQHMNNKSYTDEDLYQLVVQLKRQSEEKKEKIKILQIQLDKRLKNQTKLKQLNQSQLKARKSNQLKAKQLLDKLNNQISQKQQLTIEIQSLTNKLKDVCQINEQLQQKIQLKSSQVQKLQEIARNFQEIKNQNYEFEEMTTKYRLLIDQYEKNKKQTEIQYLKIQQSYKKIESDNFRLKQIICKKLSYFDFVDKSLNNQNKKSKANIQSKSNQIPNKQNIAGNEMQSASSKYIKDLVEQKLKDKKLIEGVMQKQVKRLVSHIYKKE